MVDQVPMLLKIPPRHGGVPSDGICQRQECDTTGSLMGKGIGEAAVLGVSGFRGGTFQRLIQFWVGLTSYS